MEDGWFTDQSVPWAEREKRDKTLKKEFLKAIMSAS